MKLTLEDIQYMESVSRDFFIDKEGKIRFPDMKRDLSQKEFTLIAYLKGAYCVFRRTGLIKEDVELDFNLNNTYDRD